MCRVYCHVFGLSGAEFTQHCLGVQEQINRVCGSKVISVPESNPLIILSPDVQH